MQFEIWETSVEAMEAANALPPTTCRMRECFVGYCLFGNCIGIYVPGGCVVMVLRLD